MFSTFSDYKRFDELKFAVQYVRKYDEFADSYLKILKTKSSIKLTAMDKRHVVESKLFWRPVGTLFSVSERLEKLL